MPELFKDRTKKPEGICCVSEFNDGLGIAHILPQAPHVSSAAYLPLQQGEDFTILSHWIKAQKLIGADCAYVLSSQDYRLILLDAPNLPDEELKSAAPWLVKDLIDFPVNEALVDVFKIPVKVGDQAKIYMVVAKKDKILALKKQVSQVGMNLVKVDILELALANALSAFHLDDQGVGLLYEDAGTLQLMIVQDNCIFLIRKVGTSSTLTDERGVSNMILECQRSFDFYQTGMRQRPIAQLYVMPKLLNETHLVSQLEQGLTVGNKPFNVVEQLQVEGPVECGVVIGEGLGYYATKD